MNQPVRVRASMQGLFESVEHEFRFDRTRHPPAYDAACKYIDYEGHEDKPLPGRNVRKICDPQLVRPLGGKLPLDQIRWPRRFFVRDRRLKSTPTNRAAQAHRTHQPLNRATRHRDLFAVQLAPGLAGPVDAEVLVPNSLNLLSQHRISPQSRRNALRIPLTRFHLVITRRSDLQLSADRLDSILGTMGVDERHHHFPRRSNSAWAKYADALRKISFARFSSRFSRSKSFIRSGSDVLSPARWPESRSEPCTQRRSDSAVHPILAAIEVIAAHCDEYSCRCSATIRTARSRTSSEYRFDVPITPSSQVMRSPGKSGRFRAMVGRALDTHTNGIGRVPSNLGLTNST